MTRPGLLWFAKYVTGPDPILLPNNIIFYSDIFRLFIRKSYTVWQSSRIYSSLDWP